MFVIKAGGGTGWQATGFENNDAIKGFSLSGSSGLLGKAMQSRAPAQGATNDFDAGFIRTMGAPLDGQCMLLPLMVRDKVAAVLYADAGTVPENEIGAAPLTVLCRFAGLWLEVTAMRKSSAGAAIEETAGAPSPASEPAAVAASAAAHAAAGPAAAGPAEPEGPDDELHRKARRFAKLLVDEIRLYNQAKVTEGRQNRDLYGRLREDIEKSRATYDKRYGESPVASFNYFNQELVRILADNDRTLMGDSFPG
ncbi:MAG: hypothetical protein LAP21_27540 [Acidobacteriia bacterium]|nr:hypothetical protein [Terriglobia bacterium]